MFLFEFNISPEISSRAKKVIKASKNVVPKLQFRKLGVNIVGSSRCKFNKKRVMPQSVSRPTIRGLGYNIESYTQFCKLNCRATSILISYTVRKNRTAKSNVV